MAHLTLVLDNREVRKFVLNKGVTTIGRAQDNDIVINNLALSRRHAQVEFKNGKYEIRDLESQNGVYVDSDRIAKPRALADKDTIALGTYQFVFRAGDEPETGSIQAPRVKVKAAPQERQPVKRAIEDEASIDDHVPMLVLKYNDVELQKFPLRAAGCVIGRAKECDVQIAERRLSRRHCEVVREGGRWLVKDLGSQNGTYVNRKRLRGPHELKTGDLLNFAEYAVLYLPDVASYSGPDSVHGGGKGAPDDDRNENGQIAAEETVMPEAYPQEYGYEDDASNSMIRPQELTDDPESNRTPIPPVAMRPGPTGRREVRPLKPKIPNAAPADPLVENPKVAAARRSAPPAPDKEKDGKAGAIRAIREKEARTSKPPPGPVVAEPSRGSRPPGPTRNEVRALERSDRERASAPPPPERERDRDRDRDRDRERVSDREGKGERERGSVPAPPERERERLSDRERPSGGERDRGGKKEKDEPKKVRDTAPPPPRRSAPPASRDGPDVPDEVGAPEPEPALDEWYASRNEKSELYDALEANSDDRGDEASENGEVDESMLPPRGRWSISRVLSTMMVDKRELDRNLRNPKVVRQRKFYVEVRRGDQNIYSGPLNQAVTILGTDPEADIQLKGRYVAGRHSLLVRVRDSLLLVRLGSSSAARVNGLPKLQAFLKSGDVIQIDETTIKVSED